MEIENIIRNLEKQNWMLLSDEEFIKVRFLFEKRCAETILQTDPFSERRRRYITQTYNVLNRFNRERAVRKGSDFRGEGSSELSVVFVETFIKKIIKSNIKNKQTKIRFVEAGVGSGYTIRHIRKDFLLRIDYYGIDVFLDKELERFFCGNLNVKLDQKDIYDMLLDLPDSSIDLFYADNVFEHLLPDEIDEVYQVLSKKMKTNGFVLLNIPDLICGPHDVSKNFLPLGSKPVGMHFMEVTYSQNTENFLKHGFSHAFLFLMMPKTKFLICYKSTKRRLSLKIWLEGKVSQCKFKFIKKLVGHAGGYFFYALQINKSNSKN